MATNTLDLAYWSKQHKIRKLMALEYKGGKCQMCGYDRCPGALDFHHRDPKDKEFGWEKLKKRRWAKIIRELDKCDLLCSNCHRETHFDPNLWEMVKAWRIEVDLKPKITPKVCTCGTTFRPTQSSVKHCSIECGLKSLERTTWPTKEELEKLVWVTPATQIATMLGVSDNAVTRRCKKYGIPKPPRGYWTKTRFRAVA